MTWAAILVAVLLLAVAFTVFFGPPYLPVLAKQKETALDLLNLKPGQVLLELGSGDGRMLVAAAKRGIRVVGIELSPVLVVVSWLVTRRYRKNVRIIWGNYFVGEWPTADAIFTFMIGRQMGKLTAKIEQWRAGRPVRLASFAFKIPDKKPLSEQDGVFLYDYK